MAVTAADIVIENNVAKMKFTGTISGYTDANAMKMAFGLVHKLDASAGVSDEHDGEWLVGSETPAAADYKYAPTVADGEFEVKIDISAAAFVKGSYAVYLGTNGKYAQVSLQQANWGDGSAEIHGVKVIIRGDRSLLVAEELPPVHMTEILVEKDGATTYVKVGGALAGMTEAEFTALTPKVTMERQVGGWAQLVREASQVSCVIENGKAYVKIDISDLGVGGYMIKIGYDGASAPNTTLECEAFDKRNEPVVNGKYEYGPYFATGDNVNNADHLYGCAGIFIAAHPKDITADTTRLEAETDLFVTGASIATKEEEDTATSGTGYAKELTVSGNFWNKTTGSAEAVVNIKSEADYLVKVAYKSNATAEAFKLKIDGQDKGNKGEAADEWKVFESDLLTLTAGSHKITVEGLESVKTSIDYIELVKHDHVALASWGEKVSAAEGLCAYTPGTCDEKAIIKLEAGADLNGKLTNGNKLGKNTSNNSYDGTVISSYKFNAAAAGTVKLYMEGAFDADGNDARGFYSGKKKVNNKDVTFDYDAAEETHPTNTLMKMNGTEITLPTQKYGDLLGTTTKNTFKTFKIAEVAVAEGVNEFTITATNSYGLKINAFYVLF